MPGFFVLLSGSPACLAKPMIRPPLLPAQRPLSPLVYCLVPVGLVVGLVVAIVIGLRAFGYLKPFQVPSSGMAPFLCKGDMIFAESLSLGSRGIRRGDAVVFDAGQVPALRAMNQFSEFWINRVVALPGDRFQLKKGHVWINGALAPELKDHEYVSIPFNGEGLDVTREILIPAGQCVVLGDNTHNSLDSRYWGVLPVRSIRFVYAFHYWESGDRSLTPEKR
ncbi:MAG: leader peptidase [Verrucomicrobiaceae bacterium]|nr:leader peptidase [Verrucomicrobiaceae bacterium]